MKFIIRNLTGIVRGCCSSASKINAQKKRKQSILLVKLKECKKTGNLARTREIHAEALEGGSVSCISVANALVYMYAKCGSMAQARQVFDDIENPDVVSWNAIVLGYADNGEGTIALNLFARMINEGCEPDSYSFVASLKACSSMALMQDGRGQAAAGLKIGKQIHSEIGSHMDVYCQTGLIDMYAKCGCMTEARETFDAIKDPTVVPWNALLLGYAVNGKGFTALNMFSRMTSQGCPPDSITFVAALKACTSILEQDESRREECHELGKEIHARIGSHLNTYVRNSLIDMYANCGSMVAAREVFDGIKQPTVASWNAIILGYVENGDATTALDLYARMKSRSCAANERTFVAALKACSLIGALNSGIKIHADLLPSTELNVFLVTTLVEFYAKCGSLVKARKIFDTHPCKRDLKSWNALLTGYSHFGDDNAAFELFERMQDAGFEPNGVTFACILTCCNHAGLVEKGSQCFAAMATKYGVAATVEHYNCMLDMLGRSNKLDDAMALLQSMPCKSSTVTWMTILAACRRWKNVELGRLSFKSLVCLGDKVGVAYVLMGHIYGSKEMWKEQDMVLRNLRSISG